MARATRTRGSARPGGGNCGLRGRPAKHSVGLKTRIGLPRHIFCSLVRRPRLTQDAPSRQRVLAEICALARELGRAPSRRELLRATGWSEYRILTHFKSWSDAVRAAGARPNDRNLKLDDARLLEDWGQIVRKYGRIPTRNHYRKEGQFSPGVMEKHFGPWSALRDRFREFAKDSDEWSDVVALLSAAPIRPRVSAPVKKATRGQGKHSRLPNRPSYGNPIEFRGMRHEPVNEQGVVFLFGMVARELGYSVESIQTGFPDCEAKRRTGPDTWQRVRVEFEFESRNYRDHGHPIGGCDVIVCWHHNWPGCPSELEVVELRSLIPALGASEE